VQQAACAALLQLVKGLKQSVHMYQSTELARSEYGDAATAAAAVAAKGKPITTDFASCLPPYASASGLAPGGGFTGHSAGFMDAAKALAAAQAPVLDPSCPNSYPQLILPDLGADAVWRLPAGALQGAEVDVTAVVVSICLQVRWGTVAVFLAETNTTNGGHGRSGLSSSTAHSCYVGMHPAGPQCQAHRLKRCSREPKMALPS
jgi:hypothetical protein